MRSVALEPKAFNLLAVMVQRPGHLFTKQEIFDLVWPGTAVTDHALTRIVAQIRRALGDEAREARFLETVPTRGYRWIHPVETIDAVASDGPRAVESSSEPTRRRAPISLVPVIALAVALVVAFVWARRDEVLGREAPPTASGRAAQWPVQLTTHAGLDLHPALSPHDDAIVYVSDRSGAFEIISARAGWIGDGNAADERRCAERAAGLVTRRSVHCLPLAAQWRNLDRAIARRDTEANRGRRLAARMVARWCADRVSVRLACGSAPFAF